MTEVDLHGARGRDRGARRRQRRGQVDARRGALRVAAADGGEIRIEGAPVKVGSPRRARILGIAAVHQVSALCDPMGLVDTPLARPGATRGGLVDEIEMELPHGGALRSLGVRIPPTRTTVAALSGGQRQMVATRPLARLGAAVLVLDEPTAVLSAMQSVEVLNLVERVRERGVAVVLVTITSPTCCRSPTGSSLRLGRNAGSLRRRDDERGRHRGDHGRMARGACSASARTAASRGRPAVTRDAIGPVGSSLPSRRGSARERLERLPRRSGCSPVIWIVFQVANPSFPVEREPREPRDAVRGDGAHRARRRVRARRRPDRPLRRRPRRARGRHRRGALRRGRLASPRPRSSRPSRPARCSARSTGSSSCASGRPDSS